MGQSCGEQTDGGGGQPPNPRDIFGTKMSRARTRFANVASSATRRAGAKQLFKTSDRPLNAGDLSIITKADIRSGRVFSRELDVDRGTENDV